MRYITLPENIETKVFVLDSNALTETPKVLQKYLHHLHLLKHQKYSTQIDHNI